MANVRAAVDVYALGVYFAKGPANAVRGEAIGQHELKAMVGEKADFVPAFRRTVQGDFATGRLVCGHLDFEVVEFAGKGNGQCLE